MYAYFLGATPRALNLFLRCNTDDNGFLWFKTFHDAQPGSVYYDNGKAFVPDLVKAFGELMDNNTLPQVSVWQRLGSIPCVE